SPAAPVKPEWRPRPLVAPPSPKPAVAVADSADPVAPHDSAAPRAMRRIVVSAVDSAKWPVQGPEPLPGSLLPGHRIVAYYGNPLSRRMGILGQLPRDSMLARLEETAMQWARADTTRKVMPALHLIAAVAQGRPGSGGKYRLRMTDSLIDEVASWMEQRGWVVFLDVQTGHSTVRDELVPLLPFLRRPYVHLALDPEFAMKLGGVPGRRIGTLDASDVNHAIEVLAGLVSEYKLPPKVLVVHRFTRRMLTHHDRIRLDPRVQVVIDMDGFGSPWHKRDAYRRHIVPHPVQYTGFKLFYKNDKPMMAPAEVLGLWPVPLYIQYQ
ncbi:MAG: hypothetical protein ACREMG_00875, partial [Gemmatimonadales bacterium]